MPKTKGAVGLTLPEIEKVLAPVWNGTSLAGLGVSQVAGRRCRGTRFPRLAEETTAVPVSSLFVAEHGAIARPILLRPPRKPELRNRHDVWCPS